MARNLLQRQRPASSLSSKPHMRARRAKCNQHRTHARTHRDFRTSLARLSSNVANAVADQRYQTQCDKRVARVFADGFVLCNYTFDRAWRGAEIARFTPTDRRRNDANKKCSFHPDRRKSVDVVVVCVLSEPAACSPCMFICTSSFCNCVASGFYSLESYC